MVLQLFLGGVSTATGLWAAYFWYRSARNEPPRASAYADFERGADGLTDLERWLRTSGQLNRYAAGLTAISVGLGALSTLAALHS
jgi:hypothetical protein